MHHVVVERHCACAVKRGMDRIRSFDTKEEAEEHAREWAESMNGSFCGRHGFDVVEVGDHFVISLHDGGFVESCDL